MEEPLSLETLLVYLEESPNHLKDFNNFMDRELLGTNESQIDADIVRVNDIVLEESVDD